ncbi:MAG: type II toxin-antitoxin system HicA family toxin [Verrucomicrobia bacterium]|nr:type II toxin-antitoxin system HicA family toxin [Verrucomicrobiota bacterium]
MSRHEKSIERIRRGHSDYAIRFDGLRNLLKHLGFVETISGSHHVFKKPGCGVINLQPAGHQAKGYQVRQVRNVLQAGNLI